MKTGEHTAVTCLARAVAGQRRLNAFRRGCQGRVFLALPLALLAGLTGCAGYSASHGPRPLEPDERMFAIGASVIRDEGESLVMPELGWRRGLTERVDLGIEWAGYTVMVDALASLWEDERRVLSGGLGASLTGFQFILFHPELYFGSDRAFVAARTFVSPFSGPEESVPSLVWLGFSAGLLLGDRESVHVLPTISAWYDSSTTLVFTINLRFPSRTGAGRETGSAARR